MVSMEGRGGLGTGVVCFAFLDFRDTILRWRYALNIILSIISHQGLR